MAFVAAFRDGLFPDLVGEGLDGFVVVEIHSLQGEKQFLAHGTPTCSLLPAPAGWPSGRLFPWGHRSRERAVGR